MSQAEMGDCKTTTAPQSALPVTNSQTLAAPTYGSDFYRETVCLQEYNIQHHFILRPDL